MKIKTEPVDEDDAMVGNGYNDPPNASNASDVMAVAGPSSSTIGIQLNQVQREKQHLQLCSTPVVVLRPLIIDDTENECNMNDSQEDADGEEEEPEMPAPKIQPKHSPQPSIPTPPPSMPTPPPSIEEVAALAVQPPVHVAAPTSENEISPNCRRIYDRIAEAELKIKLLQQQKEEQALEFERELHARRVAILDTDLKKKNLEIEYLARSHQPIQVNNNLLPLD